MNRRIRLAFAVLTVAATSTSVAEVPVKADSAHLAQVAPSEAGAAVRSPQDATQPPPGPIPDLPPGATPPEDEAAPAPETAPLLTSAPVPAMRARVVAGDARVAGADHGPVALRVGSPEDVGREFEIEVLPEALAARAGADGFLFRVSDLTAAVNPSAGRAVRSRGVELEVDYRAVAAKFGGEYASRLQLRKLPACALEVPVPFGCNAAGELLSSVNDFTTDKLRTSLMVEPGKPPRAVASIDLMAGEPSVVDPVGDDGGPAAEEGITTTTSADAVEEAPLEEVDATGGDVEARLATDPNAISALGGGTMVALTSGSSGALGSYSATPLDLSSSWQVGVGSGGFDWSYPVAVQPGPAGDAPEVELSYSSASIDGMVGGENNQAPMAGSGWGITEAFIERRYVSCAREGIAGAADLCWRNDNAVLHLNGISTELVAVSANEWRARHDANWKITRLTGASNSDSEGEYWRVITPDGTRYEFGRGAIASEGNVDTGSVWMVPVWGDDAGDPCNGNAFFNLCHQAWRWNLDRVVDPKGNRTAYIYSWYRNSYRLRLYNTDQAYDRGGHLARIDYGLREGSSSPPQSRVVFDTQYRCNALSAACGAATPTNGAAFPDVPNDLICSAGCTKSTPTFFSDRRYSAIRPQTFRDGAWNDVDEIRLVHEFEHNFEDHDADGNVDRTLWLRYIDRQAKSESSEISVPAIRFDSYNSLLPNRADSNPSAGVLPLLQWRVDRITTDSGSEINVSYGQPHPCTPIPTGTWDTQTKNCFPRQWQPPDSPAGFAIWHKYVVTQVRTTDLVGGSPEMVTNYSYEGQPAWHYDDNPMVLPSEALQSWSDWRGYASTVVIEGAVFDVKRTRYLTFRGMDADRLANGSTKSVSITSSDGVTLTDSNWLAGRTFEAQQLDGSANIAKSSRWSYTAALTAGSGNLGARWVAESARNDRFNEGGTRARTSTTSYNANRLPELVVEGGWDDTAVDDRCTRTSYATDSARHMLSYPSQTVLYPDLTCTSATEVRNVRYFYDGSTTLGALPGAGNLTRTQSKTSGTTFVTKATTTYDPLGRPLVSTDANSRTMTTGYIPASSATTAQHASQITSTNHLGHVTTTSLHKERLGSPTQIVDPNGMVTTLSYDALGRSVGVWLPTEQPLATNAQPTKAFAYDLNEHPQGFGLDRPPWAGTTHLLTRADPYEIIYTYEVYDGLLRPRQSGRYADEPGSIVSQTRYDARGLRVAETAPQHTTGWPFAIANLTWNNETVYAHDLLGRPTSETFRTGGANRWTTLTSYTRDTTTVDPPVGGDRRSVVDGHDRTVQVSELGAPGIWDTATYAYNAAGDLVAITDPLGNSITYLYDRDGRRTQSVDPDAGTWNYGYDPAGNQTTVDDADPATPTLVTVYDALNRPIERRTGSSTGPLLASWSYDATGERGLLDRSIRHDPGLGAITSDVTGYDARSRPTGRAWTMPTGGGALAGTYSIGYAYDALDNQTQLITPAIHGLPAETITSDYASGTGTARTLTGLAPYVSASTYDNRGRLDTRTLGTGPQAVVRNYDYDNDLRLNRWHATNPSGIVIQDDQITRDPLGNVTSRHDARTSVNQSECFKYDLRNRLVNAFTVPGVAVTGTGPCTATPATGGPTPYSHTYTYARDGKITSRNEGSATRTYTYPAQGAGSVRPHAVTDISGTTNDCNGTATGTPDYCYDPNGNLTGRPGSTSTSQTLTWNAEHQLQQVDDNGTPTGGETTFVYDADGARLIRKTPTDTTLYIDSHELTLTGTTLTTKRYYTLGGVTVAVRDSAGSGALTYLLGDQLGSTTTSVNASTGATQTQRFLPYGAPRSGSIAATDRGWIGQTKDNSTGLQYLNARYYDPTIGRFTATDPLADLGRPSTLDAYGYAGGSPVTMSDPSGLLMTVGSGGKGDYTYGAVYTRTGRIVGGNPSGRPPRWVQEAIDQFVGGNPVHYPDDPVMDAAVQAGFAPTGSSDPLGDAMRAGGRFFFDPSQCEDKASWGCSIQTAGLLPWGKLGKLGKWGKFLRFGDNADEFADAAKAVGPTISRQRQLRHVANTEDWIARGKGGYFNSVDDAQSVLDGVHDGSAVLLGRTRNGDLLVRHDGVTGFNNNAAAGYVDQPTNVFIVKGTSSPSVVPTSPRAKPAG